MSKFLNLLVREWRTFRAHPKATLFSFIAIALIALGVGLSITFYLDLQERQERLGLPQILRGSRISHLATTNRWYH